MKIIKIFILLMALIVSLTGEARSENTDIIDKGNSSLENIKENVPDDTKNIIKDFDLWNPDSATQGLKNLWSSIKDKLFLNLKNAFVSASKLFSLVLLCGLGKTFLNDSNIKNTADLCVVAAVSLISLADMKSFFGMGIETLYLVSDFSKVLLPGLCSAAAAAGAVSSSALKYAASVVCIDVLINLGTKIILPLISLSLALSISDACIENDSLTPISNLMRWACKTLLVILVTAFTAYLSFSGIIAGKSDELAAKVTKSALNSLLPVVGGIISDAAGTVVSGAGLIRNGIGALGMLAVAGICAGPFVALGSHYLVFKITAAFTAAISDKRIGKLIDGIAWGFGMILALVGSSCVMVFISAVSCMKAVNIV